MTRPRYPNAVRSRELIDLMRVIGLNDNGRLCGHISGRIVLAGRAAFLPR